MKFVALNELEVVAIEKDGAINLDIPHTKVISVDDDEPVELNWEYLEAPAMATIKFPLFVNPNIDPATIKPAVVYAVDENGQQYVVENP
jgi:hypothetical protein